MKNPFLIGKTIYLRPMELDDAPILQSWINDPDVRRTLQVHQPINRLQQDAFVRDQPPDEKGFHIGNVTRSDDRLIGNYRLTPGAAKDRKATFGIMIGAKEEWDKGYGSEAIRMMLAHAFESLNLNRVALDVYEFNPRAIKTYERAGFKREGIQRKAFYREGRYWDIIMMAILREEWEALSK